ncbi:MAG: Flp family type IVb pilin [Acidobacteriota bacterium]|nr:Flp family type IVb pilin [Acidobacteriota bacterium]
MPQFVQGEAGQNTHSQPAFGSVIVWQILKRLWQEEDAQDMVEYALLLAFVALAAVSLLSGIGTSIKGVFTSINTNLAAARAAGS